jgi:hypothetical protein
MSISDTHLHAGQAAIAALEKSLSILQTVMSANTQCNPLFIRRVPLRGVADVPSTVMLDEPLNKDQALEWGINSLISTRWDRDQNPKETKRCPGVIVASEKVLAAAREVNEAKAELKKVVDNIPKRERGELYRSVNRFSSLQAMRLIEIVSDVEAITFRWNFTDSADRVQCSSLKKELLSSLSDYIGTEVSEKMLTMQTSNDEMYKVASDFNCIAHIPDDEVLAIVRPIRRHVRAYISPHKNPLGGRLVGRGYYIQAKTPILVSSAVRVNASELSDQSSKEGLLIEKESVFESEPLIERLGLFRYIDSKRIFELPERNNKSRMKGGNYLEVSENNH